MRISRALTSAALAVSLLLSACGPKPADGPGGTPPSPAGSPTGAAAPAGGPDAYAEKSVDGEFIKIGAYLPITGDSATFGQGTKTGMDLAVEKINAGGGVLGKKLKIIYEDTQGKTDQAAQAAQKLINQDNVLFVLGEVISSNSLAVAPICQEAKVPMISPSSTNPKVTQVGDYIFRVCFTDDFQGEVIARFAAEELKKSKAALLIDQSSDYSKGLSDAFKRTFQAKGGTIVAEEYYTQGDSDFASVLNKLKGSSPDVLVVPGYYKDVGLIASQAKQQGLDVPMLGGDGWDSPSLTELGGAAINGSYFSTHYDSQSKEPMVVEFVAAFKKVAGNEPDSLSAMGYDAVMVMADAMKRAGKLDRQAMRDALASTKDFPGLTGSITINANRDADKAAVIQEIRDGKLVPVARIAPEGAGAPAPASPAAEGSPAADASPAADEAPAADASPAADESPAATP